MRVPATPVIPVTRRRRRTAAAAVVASIVVALAGTAAPPTAATPSAADQVRAAEEALAASAKVTSEVRRQLGDGSRTDFWLRLGDLPDLSREAGTDDWGVRGQNVVHALQAAAQESQAGVVAELDRAGADYQPFWITNAILVRGGSAELAARMAAVSAVERLSEVTYVALEEPVDTTGGGQEATAVTTGVAWGVEEIGAPSAWAQGYTGEGITVANLDTGVDVDHPALWRSYAGARPDGSAGTDYTWFDVVDVCDDTGPCDPGHHGSHTMGTMVGDDLAGHRIGVAPGADWIATNPLGEGSASDATMLEAAQWTLEPTRADGTDPDPARRPHVVNNSWGGGTSDDPWFDDLHAAWEAAGIFAVFAGGNDGPWCDTSGNPGNRSVAYSVGAYDEAGAIADFSSRGDGEDGEVKPNIAAPGADVFSANGQGGYYYENGTSMASPHVAGVVALLWNAEPTLVGDVAGTRALLDATARDVDDTTCGGTAEDNNVWGEGKVWVPDLIEAAREDTVTSRLDVTVTDTGGAALEGAQVRVADTGLTATTTGDGTVSLPVRAGQRTLDVEISAFSYTTSRTQVSVPESGPATLDVRLDRPATHTLTGTVTESAQGRPVAGATVQLTSAAGITATVTSGTDGGYEVVDAPAGTYTVRVDSVSPLHPVTTVIDVAGDTVTDAVLATTVDGGRYSALPGTGPYLRGDTSLTVHPAELTPVELPFDFAYYGGAYRTAYVSTSGYLTFEDGSPSFAPSVPPTRNQPNAAVYAQWSPASFDDTAQVLTAQTSVDGQDAVVVEWRDVPILGTRASFSATLVADGSVILGYGPQSGRYSFRSGGQSVIGLEDETGAVASTYAAGVPGAAVTGTTLTYSRPADTVFVTGTVTDRNDGLPMGDAAVSARPAGGRESTTRTHDDGTYRLAVGPGSSAVTATARRYEPVTSTVHAGPTGADLSPALPTGRADIEDGPLQWRLAPNGTATTDVTVRNTGTAPLSIERIGTMFPADDAVPPGADGIVLDEWQVPGAFFPFGVAHDGDVWVNNFLAQQLLVLDRHGDLKRTLPYQGWSSGGALTLDATTGDMCQLTGGGQTRIVCFDRQTGELRRTYEGPWSSRWSGGLTYDSAEDVFYLGSSADGTVTVVAGSTHAEPGAIVRELQPDDAGIVDLAFHGTSDTLWMASGWGFLHQLDPRTGTILRTVEFAPDHHGGIAFESSGALWAMDQEWSTMYLLDVGEDPTFDDVPWLDIDASTTTIPPDGTATLTLTVRAGSQAGIRTTDVALITDAGRERVTRAPARLEIVHHDVAVDVGGDGFTDAAGITWEPDQRLRGDGAWGWSPPGRASATTEPIGGTDDDPLFRSARIGREVTYTFRDLPSGTYHVTVGFADQRPDPEPSPLDVIVDGRVEIDGLDIGAQVGGLAALARTVPVQHPGGDLTVRVTGSRGSGLNNPHLAALRVSTTE